jgi:site-specific recombinase XerC
MPRRSNSQGGSRKPRLVPLVRVPRILAPEEVDRLAAALRTDRDRAIVLAMVVAGLRRCEVLGPLLVQVLAAAW